jgi:hypothetical protein
MVSLTSGLAPKQHDAKSIIYFVRAAVFQGNVCLYCDPKILSPGKICPLNTSK